MVGILFREIIMATMIVKVAGRYHLKRDGLYLGAGGIWVDNTAEAEVYTEAGARQIMGAMKAAGAVAGVLPRTGTATMQAPPMDHALTAAELEAEQRARFGASAGAPRAAYKAPHKKSGQGIPFLVCLVMGGLGIWGMSGADAGTMTMKLSVVSLLLGIFGVWVLILWAPIVVAKNRQHPNIDMVRILCLLSFFLPILWVAAAIYAYTGPKKE